MGLKPRAKGSLDARRAAITSAVAASADPERAAKSQKSCPTALAVLGTPVPALRQIVNEHKRELRQASPAEVLALANALIADRGLETRQVAYELIGTHRETVRCLDARAVESLGAGIDNWRSTDAFASEVSGPAWREGALEDATVHAWMRSGDPWWRRAALVSTFALNAKSRGGRGEPERTLRLCAEAVDDRHDMVVKALSWAVREVISWDRAAVEIFLEKYGSRLHGRVVREVRSKLDTGLKN